MTNSSSITRSAAHCPKSYQNCPRYNTKCRGKQDATRNIPRNISVSPLHFMLYFGKSITFGQCNIIHTCRNITLTSRFWENKLSCLQPILCWLASAMEGRESVEKTIGEFSLILKFSDFSPQLLHLYYIFYSIWIR